MPISSGDLEGAGSLFARIADAFRRALSEGRLGPGDAMPTEADLSRHLGVSRVTVSRGYELLREEGVIAQQRGSGSVVTEEAPHRLGIPPRAPLRSAALVIDAASLDEVPSYNRFLVFDTLEGLADRFEPAQINLCYLPLRAGGEPGDRQRLWHRLLRFDGLVLFGDPAPAGIRVSELIRDGHIPAVSLGASEPMPGIARVTRDLAASARQAASYLLQKGHRHIGYVGARGEAGPREKHRGFQEGLAQRGLALASADTVACGGHAEDARSALHEWVAAKRAMPDAFFADTDYRAMGVIRALRDAGYSVPDDVAVIGFDNVVESARFAPPLTTVNVPRREAAQRAADLLMHGPMPRPGEDRVIVPESSVVERQSVRARPPHETAAV